MTQRIRITNHSSTPAKSAGGTRKRRAPLNSTVKFHNHMKKVFSCGGVPEDEINDVRRILFDAKIAIWESPKSNWGFQNQAFWVHNKKDYAKARQLIDGYQKQRAARFGSRRSRRICWMPFEYTFYGLVLVVILYWLVLGVGSR